MRARLVPVVAMIMFGKNNKPKSDAETAAKAGNAYLADAYHFA
jgi:hypothetical protein